ncbi:MAG: diacylglycerol kinase family lipid kinase [Coriobacteriia bacterium]|nr:diacylglycerol kinase family lipid kinase [Coriobacteriia bacterium]
MALGKMLFIVNPAAKHGETAKLLPALRHHLQGVAGFDIQVSAGPRHAHDIAAHAVGYDVVIAVGGDGTVHEVVNGVMAHPAVSRPAFGVVPTGSGNDYARTLGMSNDLPTALRQIATGNQRYLDLGLCNGTWFAESISIGLDARVTVKAVELKTTTKVTGLALYMRALIYVLNNQYHAHKVTVRYDEDLAFKTEMLIIAVTNGPTYGGGFVVTPDAVPYDGLFDVCRIDGMPKAQAYARLPFIVLGKHTKMKPIHMSHARKIRVVSDTPVEGQLDGEVFLASEYDIRIEPGALSVIMPAPADKEL